MRRNLIFDADDTLWENNVLFERAVEEFIAYADDPLPAAEVRARLDAIEEVNCQRYGYGVHSFERSLGECLVELRGRPLTEGDRTAIAAACAPIRREEVELIDGVAETLRLLADRHSLFLLTKGDHAEQTRKIKSSGLADLFSGLGVVPEKATPVYHEFAAEHGLVPEETWMIGNSPRSDIWPALEAGLGAVLVPHPLTWSLEKRDLPDGYVNFRTITPFAGLRHHF